MSYLSWVFIVVLHHYVIYIRRTNLCSHNIGMAVFIIIMLLNAIALCWFCSTVPPDVFCSSQDALDVGDKDVQEIQDNAESTLRLDVPLTAAAGEDGRKVEDDVSAVGSTGDAGIQDTR